MSFIRIQAATRPDSFNLSRKLYHMLGLVIPFALYFDAFFFLRDYFAYPTRTVGVGLLAFGLVFMLVFDSLRFVNPRMNAFFMSVVGPLLKEEEQGRFNATIPYFFACLVLFLFASREVACVSCIFLMIGDPFAAYVGGFYGRVRFWNNKSMEGLGAFIVFGFLGAIAFLLMHTLLDGEAGQDFFLYNQNGPQWAILLAVFIGVVCASLGEFFSGVGWRGIFDDNLIVPLTGAAGIVLAGIYVAGISSDVFLFDPNLLF